MKELLARLEDIGEKADYLDQKSQMLVEENRRLREQVAGLEAGLREREEEMKGLREQYEIVKFARNMEGGREDEKNEELKNKINEYIREIDQCLKLIGD